MTRRWLELTLLPCLGVAGCQPADRPAPTVVDLPDVSVSAASTGEVLPRRAPDPLGWYSTKHEVTHVCDEPDWCVQEVTDGLFVASHEAGLMVDVELVQTNFHTCTWSGVMKPTGDQRSWGFAEGDCEIALELKGNSLILRSDGCREYCGARAHLEAEFLLSSKAQAPPEKRER